MHEHYYIDGYNLLHTLLKNKKSRHADLEEERNQLIHLLQEFSSITGSKMTIVFDGKSNKHISYPLKKHLSTSHQIQVLFSPEGSDADTLIEYYVYRETHKENTFVVSHDRTLVQVCIGMGISVMRPERFLKYYNEIKKSIITPKKTLFQTLPVETSLREKLKDFLNPESKNKLHETKK
ncbi:MAG TPA: NYN domain-containing protein [Candidatus Hydrogenedens sp.]|nr:NYN domain-containing protein [Candidatus Hydrogenedens sp.]